MGCGGLRICLQDTSLQFIRASSLIIAAAGFSLLVLGIQFSLPLPAFTPALLFHSWFPFTLALLGLLLATLGLAGSCNSTAAIFLHGTYLLLLPLELALLALYVWDYPEIKHWARSDQTGALKECLQWIRNNTKLAAVLLGVVAVLQVSSLVLTLTLICCCKSRKRSTKRAVAWTDIDPESPRVPLLTVHSGAIDHFDSSSDDEGYVTPRSDAQQTPQAGPGPGLQSAPTEKKPKRSPRSFPVLIGLIGFTK